MLQYQRLEKIDQHSAILCYVPLPGLCTYPKTKNLSVFNTLFPRNLSPFARLVVSNPIEYLLESKTFLELFSSPPFQAIVKFKWHTFARWRFYGLLFIYF